MLLNSLYRAIYDVINYILAEINELMNLLYDLFETTCITLTSPLYSFIK